LETLNAAACPGAVGQEARRPHGADTTVASICGSTQDNVH